MSKNSPSSGETKPIQKIKKPCGHYSMHSVSGVVNSESEYLSETLRTLLQATMRTTGCRDAFLFKCTEKNDLSNSSEMASFVEESRASLVEELDDVDFEICTCILTSPSPTHLTSMTNKEGMLLNVHRNGKWITKMMRMRVPSVYNNARELIPADHPPLLNFAIIPLYEKVESTTTRGRRCGVVLLGNRDRPFINIQDLDAAKSWFNAITSVLCLNSDRLYLLHEKEEDVNIKESHQILEEAKRVMLETKAISEAKDTFLATMSHEIRTPLNGIIGMADILNHTDLSEDQNEYLEIIHHCSVQLMEIITDILDYSKMAANALNLELEEFELSRSVEESHDIVRLRAEDKNLTLTHIIDSSVPPILIGDSKRIKQILVNLLTNAVKFTEMGGVNTQISWKENILHVKITDTGIGIPKKDWERVFQTFVQLDNKICRKNDGTGLGLGIVSKLLDLMKGECLMKSKSAEDGYPEGNTGTKMHIKIPLQIPKSHLDSKSFSLDLSNDEKDLAQRLVDKNVLIYETDVNNRLAICGCFLNLNMRPYACTSHQEVKMYLKNKDINFFAIFVDMDTPESNKVLTAISANVAATNWTKTDNNGEEIPSQGTPVVKIISINGNEKQLSSKENRRRLFKPIKCRKVKAILHSILNKTFPNSSPKQSPSKEVKEENITNFNILVAEDNIDNQKVISKFLQIIEPTIKITIANNGKEAVEIACDKNNNFHLILMDIKMPIMDGFEATRRIKTTLKKSCPYVVAVTATVFENDRKKCTEAGMDAYISKPINFQELKALFNVIK